MSSESKGSNGLKFWSIVFMGLGSVIGAGIVSYVGIAVAFTGRSAWIAYFVAIVLGFLVNLPLILMTTAARIKGGNYAFLATTLGDLLGGIYGILNAQPDSLNIFQPGYFSDGTYGFWQAVMILMMSTTGYTLITAFSAECEKPKTDLPLAMCIVPILLVFLYCSVGFTMSNVLPVEQTANQPLTAVAKVLFSPVVYYIFVFTGPVMALATTINSSFAIFERQLVQVTNDGWLPATLGKKNKYGIAWKYMIIFFFVGILPMATGLSITEIVSNTTFVSSIGYILLAVGILRYPKTMEGAWENRAWKIPMWAFKLSCYVCIVIRIYMLYRSFLTASIGMLVGSLIAVVLFFVWCWYRKKANKVHVTKGWELQ